MGIILTICVFVLIIVAVSPITSLVATKLVNRKLKGLKGYFARVDRIHVSLIPAQLIVYDLHVSSIPTSHRADKTSIRLHQPVTRICFTWKPLVKQTFQGSFIIQSPSLHILHHPDPATSLEEFYTNLQRQLSNAFCFDIDLTVEDGRLEYRRVNDQHVTRLSDIQCSIGNISNDPERAHQSIFTLSATLLEGMLELNGTLQTLASKPTFSVDAQLTGAALSMLNPYLHNYMRFDVQSGKLSVDAAIMASHGNISGYVKPTLCDVVVQGRDDFDKGFFNKVWERIITLAIMGIGRGRKNEISVRIPLTGTLDTMHLAVGTMIPGIVNKLFGRYVPMFKPWPVTT